MPTYNVTLRRKTNIVRLETVTLPIDAENEDEARDIVYDISDPALERCPDLDEYEYLDYDWGIVLAEEEN